MSGVGASAESGPDALASKPEPWSWVVLEAAGANASTAGRSNAPLENTGDGPGGVTTTSSSERSRSTANAMVDVGVDGAALSLASAEKRQPSQHCRGAWHPWLLLRPRTLGNAKVRCPSCSNKHATLKLSTHCLVHVAVGFPARAIFGSVCHRIIIGESPTPNHVHRSAKQGRDPAPPVCGVGSLTPLHAWGARIALLRLGCGLGTL